MGCVNDCQCISFFPLISIFFECNVKIYNIDYYKTSLLKKYKNVVDIDNQWFSLQINSEYSGMQFS